MGLPDSIEVVPVETARDRERFLQLPWRLQGGDPCWVAPTRSRQRAFLDPRRGPFYEFGEAALFLAVREGRDIGRISAHVSRRYEHFHDGATGFFGFFECENDPAAAGRLLAAAADWVRARGKTRLVGPLSFTIYDEIGLLVDGFDSLPALLLTHNPPCYAPLITAHGFRKSVDWHALRISSRDIDPAAMEAQAAEIIHQAGLQMRKPVPAEVLRRAPEIMDLFNEAWAGNWGHIPFTSTQFNTILRELRPLLRSDLIRIVCDGDRIVGFTITIPDLNPLMRELNGRLNLWHMIRLYRAAQHQPLKRVKTVLLGIRRAYRNRRLHDAMILDTYAHLIRTQPLLEQGDCSLICEQLRVFIRSLERYGARPYKTYRIFEKTLGSI